MSVSYIIDFSLKILMSVRYIIDFSLKILISVSYIIDFSLKTVSVCYIIDFSVHTQPRVSNQFGRHFDNAKIFHINSFQLVVISVVVITLINVT